MKYSLLLLLFGCYHTQYSSTPVEADIKGPTVVGWINDNQVLYSCEQQNVNPALVWVACDFVNNATKTQNACLNVVYHNNKTGSAVGVMNVCAEIAPGQDEQAFAAFTKVHRILLGQYCGADLSLCQLSIQSSKEEK